MLVALLLVIIAIMLLGASRFKTVAGKFTRDALAILSVLAVIYPIGWVLHRLFGDNGLWAGGAFIVLVLILGAFADWQRKASAKRARVAELDAYRELRRQEMASSYAGPPGQSASVQAAEAARQNAEAAARRAEAEARAQTADHNAAFLEEYHRKNLQS